MNSKLEKLQAYFNSLEQMNADDMTAKVETFLSDEELELFVRHIEDFYGIEDDEEIGLLTQLMVSGFMAAKAIENHRDTLSN
jgi:hypothetical protein